MGIEALNLAGNIEQCAPYVHINSKSFGKTTCHKKHTALCSIMSVSLNLRRTRDIVTLLRLRGLKAIQRLDVRITCVRLTLCAMSWSLGSNLSELTLGNSRGEDDAVGYENS